MQKGSNKKTQALLLVAVVVIWGSVIARYFSLKGDAPVIPEMRTMTSAPVSSPEIADSFSIALDYPDPFLSQQDNSTAYAQVSSTGSVQKHHTAKKALSTTGALPPPIAVVLPPMRYAGYILNSTGGSVARIVVDGKSLSVPAGGMVNGVQVISITRDSIQVRFQNKNFGVKRG